MDCAQCHTQQLRFITHMYACRRGAHFMQVSKWLGHSSFTVTLDVYGDYIPEQDGGAANTLPEPYALARATEQSRSVVSLRRRS